MFNCNFLYFSLCPVPSVLWLVTIGKRRPLSSFYASHPQGFSSPCWMSLSLSASFCPLIVFVALQCALLYWGAWGWSELSRCFSLVLNRGKVLTSQRGQVALSHLWCEGMLLAHGQLVYQDCQVPPDKAASLQFGPSPTVFPWRNTAWCSSTGSGLCTSSLLDFMYFALFSACQGSS